MIKTVEDRLNFGTDIKEVENLQCIILVEDNVQFYSSFLPILYTEVMKHTQMVISSGQIHRKKMQRLIARPKILLCNSYEEGMEIYTRFKDNVMCCILDGKFPKEGVHCATAGLDFARHIRSQEFGTDSGVPILLQSMDKENEERAKAMRLKFVHKQSSYLLQKLRDFLQQDLGFGPFLFRKANSEETIAQADSLSSFLDALNSVPDSSILYHSSNNDFSKWLFARQEFEMATLLRSKRASDFDSLAEMRGWVTEVIQKYRKITTAGQTVEFQAKNFELNRNLFARIGSGSLGGKGRGLGFARSIFDVYAVREQFPQWHVEVPSSGVDSNPNPNPNPNSNPSPNPNSYPEL
jgi:hypothetical protein